MKFQIYKGKNGDFYWRAKANNNKIVADSSEGYKRKRSAYLACVKFKLRAMYAAIEVL